VGANWCNNYTPVQEQKLALLVSIFCCFIFINLFWIKSMLKLFSEVKRQLLCTVLYLSRLIFCCSYW